MAANKTILQADALQRRAKVWHSLAALQRRGGEGSGPLFVGGPAEEQEGVRRTEGALHVRGNVPVECLSVQSVMD